MGPLVLYHLPDSTTGREYPDPESFLPRVGEQITWAGRDKLYSVLNVRHNIRSNVIDIFLGNV